MFLTLWLLITGLINMLSTYQNPVTQFIYSFSCTTLKVSKCGFFCGPHFHVLGLIYSVNLRIQPANGKIRTRKNSVFGPFSGSAVTPMSSLLQEEQINTYIKSTPWHFIFVLSIKMSPGVLNL